MIDPRANRTDEIFWAYRVIERASTGEGQPVTALAIAIAQAAIDRWCVVREIDPPPATYAELAARYPSIVEERRVA